MTRILSALSLTTVLATPAMAADVYMWGVGPRLGTNFLPAGYPSVFPDKVRNDTTGPDGEPAIEKVRGDFLFGFEGHYYIDGGSRLGLQGGFDVGTRFFDANVLLKYNRVVSSASVDFLVGGGAGFGTQTWRGKDNDARLRVPYFPLRAEAAAMVRAGWTAFQLTPYFQYNLQTNHFYTDGTGAEVEDVGGGFYPTVGIEFSVLFGDYEPPKPRKR